jgi:hypothetical protein
MKDNVFKVIIVLVVSLSLLQGCNGSRYTQGDRGDRRATHNRGVNNRNYRGY